MAEKQVSDTQLSYLQQARNPGGLARLLDILITVARDGDIQSGREAIHPDWAIIFRDNQDRLKRVAPSEILTEIGRVFGSASPVDAEVAEVDPESERIVFLLGAGASKPEPSGIPTVKELLPDLLSRARRLDRDDLTRLADFCEETRIENIEDLLTAAHLAEFCGRNSNILGVVEFLLFRQGANAADRFLPSGFRRTSERARRPAFDVASVAFLQDTLQVLFGVLSSRMLPAKPNKGHEAIAKYLLQKEGSFVVTTNYDCCMDLALGQPGQDFTYGVEFMNVKSNNEEVGNTTTLIKLHGSLNWFYCESCQQVQLLDIRQTVEDYLEDRVSYPVIAICRSCGGQRRGLLVPPLAMKFDLSPALNPLFDRAQRAFDQANLVTVVGFSFAEADLYISRMLSKWMRTNPNAKMLIFDPDNQVVEKVRKQFLLKIPGFQERRILGVRGDCVETLPKFLAGELRTSRYASSPLLADLSAR